jgi:hypothetical protein
MPTCIRHKDEDITEEMSVGGTRLWPENQVEAAILVLDEARADR